MCASRVFGGGVLGLFFFFFFFFLLGYVSLFTITFQSVESPCAAAAADIVCCLARLGLEARVSPCFLSLSPPSVLSETALMFSKTASQRLFAAQKHCGSGQERGVGVGGVGRQAVLYSQLYGIRVGTMLSRHHQDRATDCRRVFVPTVQM